MGVPKLKLIFGTKLKGAPVKLVTELYLERSRRILALGLFGRVALEAFRISLEKPKSELSSLISKMCDHLPNHYLENRKIQNKEYKLVSFVDSQSLIVMISEVEGFIQDLLIAILCRHPDMLGNSQIETSKLLELGDIDLAVQHLAEKRVNKIMYQKPNDYKKGIISVLSIDEGLLDDTWSAYVEAKARRDLGVHNSWKVDDDYLRKVKDAGLPAPKSSDYEYFISAKENALGLMGLLYEHCGKKFS